MPSLQQTQLPDIATLPPVMSVRLRHVLAIVEEIEAHCITVQTLDALDLDGTGIVTLYIDAGADLEGDGAEIFDLSPVYEVRWMKYAGVRIEWAFEHPVAVPAPDERAALEPWKISQRLHHAVDTALGREVAHG